MRFNAYSIPDRFIVEYEGVEVYDSNWRDSQSRADQNPGLYPGGLSGSGAGSISEMFKKNNQDSFTVIVEGPESGTAWDYEIKANCPVTEQLEE